MRKDVVWIVGERAKGFCEVCGRPEQATMAMHHRLLRSQGGEDVASNLIRICHKCHNISNYAIHMNPLISYSKGWMLNMGSFSDLAPMLYQGRDWVLLDNDGGIEAISD